MSFIKTASLLMLLGGSALAAPAKRQDIAYETQMVVDTVVVATATQWVDPSAPTAPPAPIQPVIKVAQQLAPTPDPSPLPSLPSLPSLPLPGFGDVSDAGEDGYLNIINQIRQQMVPGAQPLVISPDLVAGITKTVTDSNGAMVHAFNDKTAIGQTLAPGSADDFWSVFVQGWLCEIPSLCPSGASDNNPFTYDGTGHADIIKNPDLKSCGCANSAGIWGCDFSDQGATPA